MAIPFDFAQGRLGHVFMGWKPMAQRRIFQYGMQKTTKLEKL